MKQQQQQHHKTMSIGDAPRVLPVAAMMMMMMIAIATGGAIDGIEAFAICHRTLQQHQRLRSTAATTTATTTSTSLKYFDDCERKLEPFELILGKEGLVGRDFSSTASPSSTRRSSITNMTFSEEKLLALDTLLGYNPTSASQLSDISVEEETLRWAVDTNVVWSPDDEDDYDEEDYKEEEDTSGHKASSPSAKYDKIQDLLVASECQTTLDSLVYFWRMLADTLSSSNRVDKDSPSSSSADGTSTTTTTTTTTKLVVFPQTESLWDYDQSVLLLQAIEICKPWFLPIDTTLRLDLFHPQYKHSPRMWSQETHSPFPTVGVVVGSSQPRREGRRQQEKNKERPLSSPLKQIVDNPVIDMEATKAKLNALFESVDAVAPTASTRSPSITTGEQSSSENIKSRRHDIIKETQEWLSATQQQEDGHNCDKNDHDHSPSSEAWKVETETDPVQLYKTLWESIQSLVSSSSAAAKISQTNEKDTTVAAAVVIAPLFDGHTLHRVAVTVNAALKKLKIPVRVTRVNHPSSSTEKQQTGTAPYGLIELSLEQ